MIILALLAVVASPQGKTMAADDWHSFDIVAVGLSQGGSYYLDVRAGDLDGDGLDDDAYLKLVCGDGKLQQASYELKPRDAASGMASGKRMHKPLTVVKEWGPASPQLMAMKPTYDVKKVEGTGARVSTSETAWSSIELSNTDGLCPAAEAAAGAVKKSRSNIQNN